MAGWRDGWFEILRDPWPWSAGVETPDRVDRETGRLSAEALHGLSLLHKRRFFF